MVPTRAAALFEKSEAARRAVATRDQDAQGGGKFALVGSTHGFVARARAMAVTELHVILHRLTTNGPADSSPPA